MITRGALVPALARRRLWCAEVGTFLDAQLAVAKPPPRGWRIELGGELLVDAPGLDLVTEALRAYRGPAAELTIRLRLPAACHRDYYAIDHPEPTLVLPLIARRSTGQGAAELELELPCLRTPIAFPAGLRPPDENATPLALLLPYQRDHDLLFASQILIFSQLRRAAARSPVAWLGSAMGRRSGSFAQRCALAFADIHPDAEVHPSAVVEGSWIGPGCRIGAHCVVRYSRLGAGVQLHDGAKVEHAVVDDGCWLMHDLVLYRSACEPGVFLIHGPYQFSCFQRGSAAFACIMMDYRPDGKPIKIMGADGPRPYPGPFLGALLGEGAKALGGTALAPGIVLPAGTVVAPDPSAVTSQRDLTNSIGDAPQGAAD